MSQRGLIVLIANGMMAGYCAGSWVSWMEGKSERPVNDPTGVGALYIVDYLLVYQATRVSEPRKRHGLIQLDPSTVSSR